MGGVLSNHDVFVSCHNLFCLSKKSSDVDCTTKVLYEDMGSDACISVKGRMCELRNVRDLNTYDIVIVATEIAMITNTNHI